VGPSEPGYCAVSGQMKIVRCLAPGPVEILLTLMKLFRDSNQLGKRQPMPWVWYALANVDSRSVWLAHRKRRTYSGLRNVSERGLHLIDVHVAGKPSGQVGRFPGLDGLLVYPLRGRTLCKRIRALRYFASCVKVLISWIPHGRTRWLSTWFRTRGLLPESPQSCLDLYRQPVSCTEVKVARRVRVTIKKPASASRFLALKTKKFRVDAERLTN
jgi:hypothetical protein